MSSKRMQQAKDRKPRAPNFSKEEKLFLVDCIRAYVDIIENKETDGVNKRMKDNAWENVYDEYNRHSSLERELGNLRNCWTNMKKIAREYAADDKRATMATGGGTKDLVIDEVSEAVLALIQPQIDGLPNEHDSDNQRDRSVSSLLKDSDAKINHQELFESLQRIGELPDWRKGSPANYKMIRSYPLLQVTRKVFKPREKSIAPSLQVPRASQHKVPLKRYHVKVEDNQKDQHEDTGISSQISRKKQKFGHPTRHLLDGTGKSQVQHQRPSSFSSQNKTRVMFSQTSSKVVKGNEENTPASQITTNQKTSPRNQTRTLLTSIENYEGDDLQKNDEEAEIISSYANEEELEDVGGEGAFYEISSEDDEDEILLMKPESGMINVMELPTVKFRNTSRKSLLDEIEYDSRGSGEDIIDQKKGGVTEKLNCDVDKKKLEIAVLRAMLQRIEKEKEHLDIQKELASTDLNLKCRQLDSFIKNEKQGSFPKES